MFSRSIRFIHVATVSSALLVCHLSATTSALRARQDQSQTELQDQNRQVAATQARIVAGAGGARYKTRNNEPGAEARSLTDQSQFVGAILEGAGGDRIFYRLHAGIFASAGEYRFARTDPVTGLRQREDTDRPEALSAVPGDEVALGLVFCAAACEFSIGRAAPADRVADRLSGGHGALSGLHLHFRLAGYGAVWIAPLHRPELAGTYLPSRSRDAPEPVDLSRSELARLPGLRKNFLEIAGKARAYGHRLMYTGEFGVLRLGLSYGLHRQNDTANPASAADMVSNDRVSIDQVEYTGVGAALVGKTLYASVHLERTAGSYRTLLADTSGERAARIEGHALLLSAGLVNLRGFHFDLEFLLPEPARRDPGSARSAWEQSGYIGFGDTPLRSPLLADTLDFYPTPVLCSDARVCQGLEIRNFNDDTADPSALQETSFRDHAAVLSLRPSYAFDEWVVALGVTFLAKLAPGKRGGRTPFQRTKKDPHAWTYREFEAAALWKAGGEGEVFVRYSRLYRRHAARGSQLAGESLHLSISYRL